MEIQAIIISAAVTIFALGLLNISLASYKKYKNPKLLYISLAFLVVFIRGVVMSFGVFFEEYSAITTSSYMGLFDLAMLVFLFIATLKR